MKHAGYLLTFPVAFLILAIAAAADETCAQDGHSSIGAVAFSHARCEMVSALTKRQFYVNIAQTTGPQESLQEQLAKQRAELDAKAKGGWDASLQAVTKEVQRERAMLDSVVKNLSGRNTPEARELVRRLKVEVRQLDLVQTIVETKSRPIIDDLKAMYNLSSSGDWPSYGEHQTAAKTKLDEVDDEFKAIRAEIEKVGPGYNELAAAIRPPADSPPSQIGNEIGLSVALKTQFNPGGLGLWLIQVDFGWFGLGGLGGDLIRFNLLNHR